MFLVGRRELIANALDERLAALVAGLAGFSLRGAAFYTDDYVKTDGTWRIKRTAYKRTYEEVWKRSAPAPQTLTASWFETGGQSQLPIPDHVAKLMRSSSR